MILQIKWLKELNIVEIDEMCSSVLDGLGNSNIIHCACAEIDKSISCNYILIRAEGLEENRLVGRELEIGLQLLVETVESIGRIDLINSVEPLYAGKRYAELINHGAKIKKNC